MTKSVAKELAGRGVLVNAVAPGYIETDMTADLPEAARTALMTNIALQRLGRPEDIAPAVRFLAGRARRTSPGRCWWWTVGW